MKYIEKHPYVFLGLCALVLFLAANSFLAITDSAESNYALTAKEMVLSGDWLSPQIYGHYWYDKPIFYYWELALSFSLFGFTEFAARLPSALMGTAGVLFTYWFTARVYGRSLAFSAAIILMTSVECWLLSKAVITDATLFLFMSACLAFFYLGYTENRRWYWAAYVMAALAVLTKGPVGLALPALAALIFLIMRHDLKELFHVHLLSGMLLFFVIAGLWYGFMYKVHGYDFLLNFFGVHNFLRATVPEHGGKNLWYFYIIIFFVGFAPWSFTWPWALWKYRKERRMPFAGSDSCALLLALYAAVTFIFFTIVATKYTTYTYPALFSLSILSAGMLQHFHLPVRKIALAGGVLYTVLVFTAAPPIMLHQSGKDIGQTLARMDTDNAAICFYKGYSTSAVFYSGKTIYRAVPSDELEKLQPGKMDWNAKNVMPMASIDTLMQENQRLIIIDQKHDNTVASRYYALYGQMPDYISLPGNTTIWSADRTTP